MEEIEEIDALKVLGVNEEASESDVRKAYRKRSLKVHPDRNPNNPTAAEEFHLLTLAAEILLDPIKRTQIAEKSKAKAARKERFAKFDTRRQDLQAELERREEEAREKVGKKRQAMNELEKIKEEGKRMRLDKQQRLNEDLERERKLNLDKDDGDIVNDDDDYTVRIKWLRKDKPSWTVVKSDDEQVVKNDIMNIAKTFGDVSQILLPTHKEYTASGKKPKHASALIQFKDVYSSFSIVQGSQRGLLSGITVTWARGTEPQLVKQLRSQGKLNNQLQTPIEQNEEFVSVYKLLFYTNLAVINTYKCFVELTTRSNTAERKHHQSP